MKCPRHRIGVAVRRSALAAAVSAAALTMPCHGANIPAATIRAPLGYPKDFCVVKRDGLFHVFYIETGPSGDFNYLGHQTSEDLYHWQVEPNVLVSGRNGWNRDAVWAPSIIERDGVYFMFYTGVRQRPDPVGCPGAPLQAIGVATSIDLESWTLELDPWLEPAEVPWAIPPEDSCANPSYGSFRDPFVFQDPLSGDWLLNYVAAPSAQATSDNVVHAGPYDSGRYVVGVASAPHAFAGDSDWTDLHALWITHEAFPGGPGFRTWESPHVFRRSWQGEDLWFLFASVGHGATATEVDFMTGPSPTLDRFAKNRRTGWTWRGRINNLGIVDQYGNALESFGWFATEQFRDPDTGREYFANCANATIEVRQLRWRESDYGFDLEQPFRITELACQPQNGLVGDVLDLVIRGKNVEDGSGPKSALLEAIRVDEEGDSLEALPTSAIGLPGAVPLQGDVTHVPWSLPRLADDPVRVRLRLAPPNRDVQTVVVISARRGHCCDRPGDGHDMAARPSWPDAPALEEGPGSWALRAPAARPGSPPNLILELGVDSRARLDLLDVGGRRVRRLVDQDLPRGATRVVWDGRDDQGRALGSGLYFARLSVGDRVRNARVLLIP